MRTSTFLSVAYALSTSVSATVYQGFNYGSTFTSGAAKVQSDFEAEFTAAQNLVGTSGAFTSARLYTMIVCLPFRIACHWPASNHFLHSKAQRLPILLKQFPLLSRRKHLSFSEYGRLVEQQM
jgi:hypothetical protein